MTFTRTFDLVALNESKFPREDILSVKRFGKWEKFSTEQYRQFTDWFSCGLLEMGFQSRDKIATVSNNRPEWNFVDMGMAQIGVVHVPIYPTVGEHEYRHILSHSEARILILSSKDLHERINPWARDIPNIEEVYTFDVLEGIKSFDSIIELGKANYDKHITKVRQIADSIDPNDLHTIIYTSGTTGLSKGVMLSHYNLVENVSVALKYLPFGYGDKALSFLPLCHVLERMVNYLMQYSGTSIYYAESIETVGDNIKEINPVGFATVPRLLEKTYDKILAKGRALTGIKKSLFFWAIDIAMKFEVDRPLSPIYKVKHAIADKLIFSKWREALGGNIKGIIVGGAALQPRLARIFWAAGIPVHEGYGLTETSPMISVNDSKYPHLQFGTVGEIVKDVEVKIAEDGEILFKGPNLMLGYFKDPERTKEAIDQDGWFHTGDIGEILPHNVLKITDRKKEIFKLSTGKYVAPQVVENKFKESEFIEQIIVIGENRRFTSAIIVPMFNHLEGWCKLHNIEYQSPEQIITKPAVLDRFRAEVSKINGNCNKTHQLKQFRLVVGPWTTETGELSPTLKLKRRFIKLQYETVIHNMYEKEE